MSALFSSAPPSIPPSGSLRGRGGAGAAKNTHRLLSSLHAASDSIAADRLIRKFVSSNSKTAALDALTHLLSFSSPFSIPIYARIRETNWFKWNPKLASSVAALLVNHGRLPEAEELIFEAKSRLTSNKDLAFFYCDLIEAFSELGMKENSMEFYTLVREIPYSGRRPYESMIKALCSMGSAAEAEEKLKEMFFSGFKPSPFEFRLVAQSYGQLGFFSEMERVIGLMEEDGLSVDTVCANIVLSCYGDNGELSKMLAWLRKMRELGIGFSLRTFNTVLNSCPTIVGSLQDVGSLPLSVEDLVTKVEKDEALVLQELLHSSLLAETLEWSSSEGKLDLHGFHAASALVILLQWMDELRLRFRAGDVVPMEISVVCGLGKHSSKRGESPVKMLALEIFFRMKSPMRLDRKNGGRFIGRGKVVKEWLC
ncbi:pentatricopeptide repeat-containing protein At2g17033 isoform X1 [Typha angustifolia]|uniref:pentatricopeptide repeat-containing protein At2g17033 isoform X1 n=1 Tax=Typha angustifolia TaxID=59011 RepID=UPI003C2E1198